MKIPFDALAGLSAGTGVEDRFFLLVSVIILIILCKSRRQLPATNRRELRLKSIYFYLNRLNKYLYLCWLWLNAGCWPLKIVKSARWWQEFQIRCKIFKVNSICKSSNQVDYYHSWENCKGTNLESWRSSNSTCLLFKFPRPSFHAHS